MILDVPYVRIETEVSDYRAKGKRREANIFGRLTKKLTENKMEFELLTQSGILNYNDDMGGPEYLDVTTFTLDGTEVSKSRSLNSEYKESVGRREIPDKGIIVKSIQFELGNKTFALKTIKQPESSELFAVIKEQHIPITKIEYLSKKRQIEKINNTSP